jgi:hypothetical protein
MCRDSFLCFIYLFGTKQKTGNIFGTKNVVIDGEWSRLTSLLVECFSGEEKLFQMVLIISFKVTGK